MRCVSLMPTPRLPKPRFRGESPERPKNASPETMSRPGNLSAISRVCDALERKTPEWFATQELAIGIAAYYTCLEQFFTRRNREQGESVIQQPSLSAPLETTARFEQLFTQFRGLHLNPQLKALSGKSAQEQLQILQADNPPIKREKQLQMANDLFPLVYALAPLLQTPEKVTCKSDVAGFLAETEGIRSQNPEWFMQRGIAKAIADYYNRLENFLNPEETNPGAVILLGDGESGGSNPDERILPTQPMERLEQVKLHYGQLENELCWLKAVPQNRRIEALHRRVIQNPAPMKQLATRLHEIMRPIVLFLAQE